MSRKISCNLASYGKFQSDRPAIYEHLSKIGIKNVEIEIPPGDKVKQVQEELRSHNLRPLSLMAKDELSSKDFIADFSRSIDIAHSMSVEYIFVSLFAGQMDLRTVHDRLRQVGEYAQKRRIKVCLETHPDLATNGDVALRTMQAVNHEAIKINFDTANVHYHNDRADISTTEELKKIIEYVASIHLKDTRGGYRSWNFPALGEGIIDFPELLKLLDEAKFSGPLTLELEGVEGEELNREAICRRVEKSFEYITELTS